MTDLTEAVQSGRVEGLKALRDRIARELRQAEGAAVAALSRELRLTLAELEQLGVSEEVDPLDDLAGRVDELAARRQQATAAVGRPAGTA